MTHLGRGQGEATGKIAWKLAISFWGLLVPLNKIMSVGPTTGLSLLQGGLHQAVQQGGWPPVGGGGEDRREEVQRG